MYRETIKVFCLINQWRCTVCTELGSAARKRIHILRRCRRLTPSWELETRVSINLSRIEVSWPHTVVISRLCSQQRQTRRRHPVVTILRQPWFPSPSRQSVIHFIATRIIPRFSSTTRKWHSGSSGYYCKVYNGGVSFNRWRGLCTFTQLHVYRTSRGNAW